MLELQAAVWWFVFSLSPFFIPLVILFCLFWFGFGGLEVACFLESYVNII